MRRSALLPFLLALGCHSAAPNASSTHESQSSTASLSPAAQRLYADVAWLADDARQGRRAGTEAGLIAGEWIAQRLQNLGLEPAGEQAWFQEFTVPLQAADGGGSYLVWAGQRVESGADLAPLFCSEGAKVSGESVWCAYGIESDVLHHNDFEGRELSGKIALILRGAPQLEVPKSDPAAQASPHGGGGDQTLLNATSVFTKVMNAKRRGAIAAILLTGPDGAPMPAFDAAHGARAGIPCLVLSQAATQRLFPVLESAEPKPSPVQLFADVRRGSGPARNVLARLRGKDSSRAVVIGAHYDHLGHGGDGSLAPDQTGAIHNGADDNASGTAVVLEVARALKEGPPLDCDVLFALWSGEELGLLGSERWVAAASSAHQRLVAKLNLDMVGRAGKGQLQVLGAGTGAGFVPMLERLEGPSGLDLVINSEGGALGGSSDHQSFLKRQIPSLHLFSGLHTDYHKPSDDVERFEAEGAARVALLSTSLMRELCAQPTIAFLEPKVDAGRERAMGGFRAWFGSVPNYAYAEQGVLIDGTSKGSPAERAGFLAGDVLLQIGDVRVDTIHDMTYALQRYKPGDVVLVRFARDGKSEEVRVTLAARGGIVQ